MNLKNIRLKIWYSHIYFLYLVNINKQNFIIMKKFIFTLTFICFGVLSFAANEVEYEINEVEYDINQNADKVLSCYTLIIVQSQGNASVCTTYTECDTEEELEAYEESGEDACDLE